MAFIVVRKGNAEDTGKTFTLSRPVTVVGRRTPHSQPDIELTDEVVSRRHLEIILKDGRYWVRDLGSTNGTMLDDDRIIPGNLYELKHNSRLGLGIEGNSAHTVLVFKETEDTGVIVGKKSLAAGHGGEPQVAWLRIDEGKKEVLVDGQPKKLSRKEYALLLFLYKHAGMVCSHDDIIEAVWSESKDVSAISDATIAQLVHRLREKVEPDPSSPTRIISKQAFGYMLV